MHLVSLCAPARRLRPGHFYVLDSSRAGHIARGAATPAWTRPDTRFCRNSGNLLRNDARCINIVHFWLNSVDMDLNMDQLPSWRALGERALRIAEQRGLTRGHRARMALFGVVMLLGIGLAIPSHPGKPVFHWGFSSGEIRDVQAAEIRLQAGKLREHVAEIRIRAGNGQASPVGLMGAQAARDAARDAVRDAALAQRESARTQAQAARDEARALAQVQRDTARQTAQQSARSLWGWLFGGGRTGTSTTPSAPAAPQAPAAPGAPAAPVAPVTLTGE